MRFAPILAILISSTLRLGLVQAQVGSIPSLPIQADPKAWPNIETKLSVILSDAIELYGFSKDSKVAYMYHVVRNECGDCTELLVVDLRTDEVLQRRYFDTKADRTPEAIGAILRAHAVMPGKTLKLSAPPLRHRGDELNVEFEPSESDHFETWRNDVYLTSKRRGRKKVGSVGKLGLEYSDPRPAKVIGVISSPFEPRGFLVVGFPAIYPGDTYVGGIALQGFGVHLQTGFSQGKQNDDSARRSALDANALGQRDYDNQRFSDALERFFEATRLDPGLAIAQYNLARTALVVRDRALASGDTDTIWKMCGRFQDKPPRAMALHALAKAIELDPILRHNAEKDLAFRSIRDTFVWLQRAQQRSLRATSDLRQILVGVPTWFAAGSDHPPGVSFSADGTFKYVVPVGPTAVDHRGTWKLARLDIEIMLTHQTEDPIPPKRYQGHLTADGVVVIDGLGSFRDDQSWRECDPGT